MIAKREPAKLGDKWSLDGNMVAYEAQFENSSKLNKYSSGEIVAGLLRAISLVPDEQEQQNSKQVSYERHKCRQQEQKHNLISKTLSLITISVPSNW